MKQGQHVLLLGFILMVWLLAPAGLQSQISSRRDLGRGSIQRAGVDNINTPVLLKISAAPLPAGSYTVGSAGYFPTLDSAFGRLHGGGILGSVTLLLTDTLYVAPSTPGDFRLIGPIVGAGPASRITIRPADNVAVAIRGNGTATLTFEDVSYLTLDGISLQGNTRLTVHTLLNTSYGWNDAIDLWKNCDHVVIQNLTASTEDIARRDASTITLIGDASGVPDSCLITGVAVTSGPIGIFVGGSYPSYTIRSRGNVVRGNHIGSPTDSLFSRGIQIEGTDGTIIENNHVENLRLSFPDSYGDRYILGINAYFCTDAIIRNNMVRNVCATMTRTYIDGILLSGVSTQRGANNWVYNNMVYDIRNRASQDVDLNGIGAWQQDSPRIDYNSVNLSATGSSSASRGSSALGFYSTASLSTARNNILVNLREELSNVAVAIWFSGNNWKLSDYNDLHVGPYDSSFVAYYGGKRYKSIDTLHSDGKEAHSVSMMPPFRPPNLHIDTTNAMSDLLNKHGTPLAGIPFDIDGQLRNPTTPDIGADEFVIPGPSTWGTEWKKDPRSPVLSGGANGTWNRHVFMPCVLYNADSTRYEMWFAASYGPNTPNWRPYRIGFATSKDGINWTTYPSPVLSPSPGTWEAYTVEQPMVIRENGQYKMWYSGSPDFVVTMIGYASSPDGIHWTKYPGNPVMGVGTAVWEAGGPYSCTVMPFLGGYRMWYGGYEAMPSIVSRIGHATSADGITWQRDTVNNPVVGTGAAGQWDAGWVVSPQVFHVGDTYLMLYTGAPGNTGTRYGGLAISNDMGITWTKHALNPVVQPSYGGWDGTYVETGTVLPRGDTFDMWHSGAGSSTGTFLWGIGHATSVPEGIREIVSGIPQHFMMSQNYPNPFNPATVVRYELSAVSDVRLAVYDLLGREVAVLVNERKAPGTYEAKFNAAGLASGVYFYRLTAGQHAECKKMVLMK
jgi:predicted GH43/DUF377 family glycosyl hydrolase